MEDFQFQRRGPAAVQPGKVAAGGRAKPAARYDDVFGGPPRSSPVPARPEDYREIFGAAAACSIPVLDLPPPPEDGYELHQCSALDYLDIFGGGDFAATYHELFASQVSNGIGAPLPSELGSTASVIGTSNIWTRRESKGMGQEKQEMPVSVNITEGLSRDQFGCSLNGVALHLNDETNLLNSPTHMASWSSKSEAVNVTIHKNQAQMVPGFAYIVKDPEFDKPNSEVDINNSFDSNSSKETSEPHLKKAELSDDLKYSVSTMKGDQRSTQLGLSGSMIASTYKDNTSFSSKNQPVIPISNGFSAKTSNYQTPHENPVNKKAEDKCQSKTATNCADTGCQSDLKIRLVASKDVRPNEEHLSCSYKDHSASCNVKLSPDCSIYDFTSDEGNTRVAEANHFQKSLPDFPPCIIPQSSEDKTTEQKIPNSIPDPQKDVTVNECVHSRSSSCQSISSLDRSCLDSTFLTVSDINLRTQPSQGPPPARPPPGRPPSKFGISGRNLRRTLTDYQKRDAETATTYKSHSFKQSVRDGSSPFDLEADVSSAAAASVAAIKEALELAQAKLKSAKVSRERKKGNLQSHRKIGLNEDLGNTTKDEHQTVQDNQRIKEDIVVQLACGNTDGQDNVFAAQKKVTAFTPSLLTGDFKEKEINTRSSEAELSLQAKHWGEPEVSSVSNIKEDRVGEWKIAEQFYEFIQSEKKLAKVPDNSLKGDTDKRSNTRVGIIEEEQNASELKRRGNLLEPPKFVVWEGDNDRWQNPCSQEPSLEFDMPWNCSLRQTETVNAHCQEKQPGKIDELLNTEHKTEWRASEEGFICELSKKNLRVNKDALKCKPSYGCQGPEKVQNGADETFGCEETVKDINVTDDYFKDHGEENIILGELSKLDGNKTEANVMYVSNVFGKDVHLKAGCINYEYGSFTESWNVEPKEASLLFGQDNGKTSKLPHQAYEWAKNENELKVPLDIPDVEGKDGTAGAHEDFMGKVRENMQEVQVIDSNEVFKSAQDGGKGTGNVKKIDDAQKARSLGGQQYIFKVLPEFPGNEDAGSPVENDAHGHETRDGKGDKRENAEMSDSDKVREMKRIEVEEKMLEEAKERERRKLKEEKERDKKLEEEKKRERIRLEEEREREGKKLEEERKLKRLEEEKAKKKLAEEREKRREEERETKRLEEERKKRRREEIEKKRLEEERERKRLEDEERENKRLEKEMEKKRLEEENERKRLEDEEREKKRLEEERKKLEDEERKKKWLEEERKKKKLEDEEREKKRLEEEIERKRLENEQRENKNLEEEEGKKLGDEEREKKRLQEENKREKSEKEDIGGKKSEEAEERRLEEERKKLEEERESREREEKERIRKKQEEEDVERSKLEEKERERRKHEEERERRRLEEIERERRKLEEKVRERKRIEEEERERKLEEEKVRERQKIEEEKAREKKLEEGKEKEWRKREEEKEREREREKDRQAVERATREAHERAFTEARERAERAAVERITAEARQRALAESRERAEKASAESLEKSITEKVSREARLRSERAAVERATAEARERAVEKAIAEKAALDARERAEKLATPSREGVKQNFSNVRDCDPQFQNVGSSRSSYQKHPDSNASFTNETSGGSEGESAIRCKARMERHQRTIERAAKALAEKNLRDIIAQREQAERNRLAETLDADVKRWSNGKEGNLRALLSTLQYILGPETGWHPIPLTDVVTAPAVKKAYRKATLCVHPDKLQQRGASIHQKYICQKVFDLLKEAWNKFNSEER